VRPGDDGDRATVRSWAGARAAAGLAEEAVDARTVGDLLAVIGTRPGLARVLGASSLLVDGAAVRREDTAHELPPGSVVDVLPPFAGG
jgi:molybdopterin synthase sulfur carrier subunit